MDRRQIEDNSQTQSPWPPVHTHTLYQIHTQNHTQPHLDRSASSWKHQQIKLNKPFKPVANPSVVFTMVKSLPLQKIHPIRCCNILLQQFTKQICNRHVAMIKATHIERDMTSYPSSVQKIMLFWCLFKCRNTVWVSHSKTDQHNNKTCP